MTGEMTVAQHNEQLVARNLQLVEQRNAMRTALFLIAADSADEKGKVRVPKQNVAADVVDVTWKVLASKSVVFTVIRREPDGE